VFVPNSFRTTTTPVPVVVDMHGFGGTAGGQINTSGWREQARMSNLIVAYPQGIGNAWDSQGVCCRNDGAGGTNDINFLKAVARTVIAAAGARADLTNVIATGLSNGGAMTQTLACEAADLFTAAIPVSFQLSGGGGVGNADFIRMNCTPARPINVLHFHGSADTVVPDNGDSAVGLDNLSTTESRIAWAQIQGCNATFDSVAVGNTTLQIHRNCRGGVNTGVGRVAGGVHVLYSSLNTLTIPDIARRFLNARGTSRRIGP
jgi:polyhydroxybutyrate depolymerase